MSKNIYQRGNLNEFFAIEKMFRQRITTANVSTYTINGEIHAIIFPIPNKEVILYAGTINIK